MTDEPLVDGILAGDQKHQRLAEATSGAPRLLQEGADTAGPPDHDTAIESADIDPHLQRIGRHHSAKIPTKQFRFDTAPFTRQVTATISVDPIGDLLAIGRSSRSLTDVAQDQLDSVASASEADGS